MAGDWIKMRGNLWDDPRIARLCDITGESEAAVIGGLYWIWSAADQHTEDGIMPGLSLRQIDRKTGVKGLGEGLVSIGWLADHPEGVRIVNFEEHNGTSAKKRAVTAKRVANHRSGNADETQIPEASTPDVTHQALQEDQVSVTCALARERERVEKEEIPSSSNVVGAAGAARAKEPKAIRLSDDWQLPKAWGEWALAEYPHWTADDVRLEAAKFADHWRAQSGKAGRKANWQATWRNWCRSDIAQRAHPNHRSAQAANQPQETAYQRSMRLRMQEAAPEFARRDPSNPTENVIDFFAVEVPAKRLEIGNEPSTALG